MRAWESVKLGNVETLEERTIYLGMSQLRGILNPNISREEEQAAWDQYHQAAMESITKRASALEAANRKLVLSPEAVKALGPVSPDLAWVQIRNQFAAALLDSPETARELAEREGLAKSRFSTEGLENLQEAMGNQEYFPPVSSINHLLESNPHLSLRDVDQLPPLVLLKAILRMRMTNEAYDH